MPKPQNGSSRSASLRRGGGRSPSRLRRAPRPLKPRPPEGPQPVELRIPARAEYVRVVRLAVAGVASHLPLTYDDIEDIKLAVTEACNNSILHAKPSRFASAAAPTILIKITPHPGRLEVSVTDEGRVAPPGLPRSPRRKISPAPFEDLKEGGLGLLLMRGLMDEVDHHTGLDSNTTVRMVKYVRASANGSRR